MLRVKRSAPTRLLRAGEALTSLLASAIISCGGITEPAFPTGAVPMQPPRVYAMWWQLTQACSGITGNFASVRWYVVPNASQIVVNGRAVQGYWWSDENRIVVASSEVLQGQLVRHEMLHALTGAGHSHEYFMDRCGGIVACEADCLNEAGDNPAPPVNAPVINPNDLSVETSIQPADPSVATDSGWVAITITAQNVQAVPVWVRMTPVTPGETGAANFGYVVRCISGSCWGEEAYNYVYADKVGFAGGQTRRYVFDRQLLPGTYSVRGFFNVDTTNTSTFQVSAQ